MIGIDIVETKRFIEINPKLFDKSELEYAAKFSEPSVHLAGFWAAKEAFLKAAGTGITSLNLNQIHVSHDQNGKPQLFVPTKLKTTLGISSGQIEISISHTKDIATAICIIN